MDEEELLQKKRGGAAPRDKRNAFKRMSGRLLRSFGNFNEPGRDDVEGIRQSASSNNLASCSSEPNVSDASSLSTSSPASPSAISFPPPSPEMTAAEKSSSAKKKAKDPKKLREQMRKRSVSMSGSALTPMLRARTPLNCTVPMARVKPQFGMPPTELLEKFPDERVPAILVVCIGLLQDSLREQGIFRIPGKMTDILEMKISFEQGNRELLENETNVHNIAGLVSQFFRELPEPLLTFGLYKAFVSAAGQTVEKKRLGRIKKLLKKLPDANFYILEFFIKFLVDLSKHSGANRMTPQNLALVFGASLLNPQELELSDLGKIKLQCTVVELLITQFSFFFEGAVATEGPAKMAKSGGPQRKLATIPAGRPTIPAGSMNSPRSAPTSPVAVPAKAHEPASPSPLARSPISRSPLMGRAAPLARPVAAPPNRSAKRASSRMSTRARKPDMTEPSPDDSSPAAETQSAKQQNIIRKSLMSAHSLSLSSEVVRSSMRDEISQTSPPAPPPRNKLAAAATAAEY